MSFDHTAAGAESDRAGHARTVTLLFADIEDSTGLLTGLGDAYEDVLDGYYAIMRQAVDAGDGTEVTTEGDGYFAVFDTARGAVAAAVAVQRRMAARSWPDTVKVRARIGLHTGEATDGPGGPVGLDVHRAARIADAGHGGQVLLSEAVRVLVQHGLPQDAVVADLGEHRLRGFDEPEHLHQLCIPGLPDVFPPLRTASAAPSNLPERLTSFVGRGHDLAEVQAQLGAHRMVTLTGPGGTGKTRLAIQTGCTLTGQYPDGIWFVELAAIRDPALVPGAIIRALRLREVPNRDLREQLLDHLRSRRLLLILDNFEQVLDAASLVTDMLRGAPGVRVLVTSRSPLHLSGEQEYPVPPLGVPRPGHLPPAEAMAQYEAVELFIQRATAARPDFQVTNANAPAVAELVARLDGLPLAIELAAARIKLLSPEAMLGRLERRLGGLGTGPRDLPRRQQTLHDTIAWSYDLLGPAEQTLVACLAVFVGGWSLERAERVCGGDVEDVDMLDALESLVDHSLVRQHEDDGEIRFDMLETIRDFGLAQLEHMPGADALRARHAAEFLDLAEGTSRSLHGRKQADCLCVLEREHANMRAALDWYRASGDRATALRMGAAMWRFWQKTSVDEGQRRIGQLLDEAGDDAPEGLRSAGLEAAGGLAYWRGDMVLAQQHYRKALAIERRLDRPSGVANALYNLALPLLFSHDGYDGPWQMTKEARALYESVGDQHGIVKARWGAGCVAYFTGRYEVAEVELLASLEGAEALDDVFYANWARHMLAGTYIRLGRLDEARRLVVDALSFFADVGDHSAVPLLLNDFSELAAAEGQSERQVRLAAASLGLQQSSGVELARLAAALEERLPVDRDGFAAAWKEGLEMEESEAVSYALRDA